MSARSSSSPLAAIAALPLLRGPAAATPAVPTAVFDPSETGWYSYRNLTSAAVRRPLRRPEGRQHGHRPRRRRDRRRLPRRRGLQGESRRARLGQPAQPHRRRSSTSGGTDYRDRGFRLVDQETYVHGGERLYAGVWIENREDFGWASYRGVTSAQFSAKFDRVPRPRLPARRRRRVPRRRRACATRAVWVENRESLAWRLRRDLTSAQYAARVRDRTPADGLRSLVVESVRTGGGQRYAGICDREPQPPRLVRVPRPHRAPSFRNRWNQLSDMGYRLDGYEKYDDRFRRRATPASGGRTRAARTGGCAARSTHSSRPSVDDVRRARASASRSPTTASPSTCRGFGYQDIDDGVWMHSGSVNRIASVSKAVAGVLGMRMDAKHPGLSLERPGPRRTCRCCPRTIRTRSRRRIMNRSCSTTTPTASRPRTRRTTTPARRGRRTFMDQALDCTPGAVQVQHPRATTARARPSRRSRASRSTGSCATSSTTTPFGLTTLRPEYAGRRPAGPRPRSTRPTTASTPATTRRTRWSAAASSPRRRDLDPLRRTGSSTARC